MTRAIPFCTRSPVCLSGPRIRSVDRFSVTANASRRRRVWAGARGRGRGRGGRASDRDGSQEPPEDKEPEPVMKEESSKSEKMTPQAKTNKNETEKGVEANEDLGDETVAPWKENRQVDIQNLKTRLLTDVAGFDRGFAAIPRDVARVRSIVESLETLSGAIDLTAESTGKSDAKDLFNGTWKLIFTSAFDAGNTSRRLGTNLPFAPFTFGPVYQVVDTKEGILDNVVEFLITGVPRVPWSPSNAVPRIQLTLRHEMSYSMSVVNIKLKNTKIQLLDSGFEFPPLTTRPLPAAIQNTFSARRAGEFSLVYLDENLRITEGSGSDLRIFVKTSDLDESQNA